MRVLHLPVAFLPWTTGGREVYAHTLALELNKLGIQNFICIHQHNNLIDEPIGDHLIDGLRVTVLPPLSNDSRLNRYEKTYSSLPGFTDFLKKIRPDVVHFHDQNGGASLSHLIQAKELGLKTVLTYHTPGQSCSQGELRYQGKKVCDGLLKIDRCTECRLTIGGLPETAAKVISKIPYRNYKLATRNDALSRLLSSRTKTELFIESFQKFMSNTDIIHTHSNWVYKLLLNNGVSENKIFLSRTGIIKKVPSYSWKRLKGEKQHFVFIGRCSKVKGIHILIKAVKLLPENAPVKIHFWGPYWKDDYGQQMSKLIENDNRFEEPVLVKYNQVINKVKEMDAVIIPSIWLETGPLTLIDALSAGVPVIGSKLGGIEEWVQNGVNGILVEPEDPHALSKKLHEIIYNPDILMRIRQSISVTRDFGDLARDLSSEYEKILSE